MAWKKRHLLKINGGPGLNLKRKRPATGKAVKLEELKKRLSKLGLPLSWATLLQRRGLRPKALREAIGALVGKREELATAQERLVVIRKSIREALTGKSEPEAPVPAPRVDRDQDDQDDSVFHDDIDD
jgi:hypothetical protein